MGIHFSFCLLLVHFVVNHSDAGFALLSPSLCFRLFLPSAIRCLSLFSASFLVRL